jgi:hypothetical protein
VLDRASASTINGGYALNGGGIAVSMAQGAPMISTSYWYCSFGNLPPRQQMVELRRLVKDQAQATTRSGCPMVTIADRNLPRHQLIDINEASRASEMDLPGGSAKELLREAFSSCNSG